MGDTGLLPESMGELTEEQARGAAALTFYRTTPLRAIQWVVEYLGLEVREASALLKHKDVMRASCDLHALCTSDWDELTISLRAPLYHVILDLLGSTKDHTRIEGARLASRLVEVQARDERKERAAERMKQAAQAKIAGEKRVQALSDYDLTAEIAETLGTLH